MESPYDTIKQYLTKKNHSTNCDQSATNIFSYENEDGLLIIKATRPTEVRCLCRGIRRNQTNDKLVFDKESYEISLRNYCTCDRWIKLKVDDQHVQQICRNAVAIFNIQLQNELNHCAHLQLFKVKRALLQQNALTALQKIEVKFQVRPSFATFTVIFVRKHNEIEWKSIGAVSRHKSYLGEYNCINHKKPASLYCFCLK